MAEALPQWPLQEHNCVTQKKKPALRITENGREKKSKWGRKGKSICANWKYRNIKLMYLDPRPRKPELPL